MCSRVGLIRLFTIVLVLLIGMGLIIGNVYLIKSVISKKCIVTELTTKRYCYENSAKIWLEQYLIISDNKTAFVLCGPVINCQTSPCNFPIVIGEEYWCYKIGDITRLYGKLEGPGLEIFGIIIICILLIIWLIAIIFLSFTYYLDFARNYLYPQINYTEISMSNI